MTEERPAMTQAVCDACGADLGGWLGEERVNAVIEDHKAGKFKPSCERSAS